MKIVFLSLILVAFVCGCFTGHLYHAQERHDVAWETGNENGWASAINYRNEMDRIEKHHYEFKQHGASVFRFDLDTGEGCYMTVTKEDYEGTSAGKAMSWCTVE